MVSRRRFLLTAGASALGARPAAFAQPRDRIRRVGFISGIARPPSMDDSIFGGFIQGMREHGYVEGKNLVIEWRFAGGQYERYPDFARELVALNVEVIVAGNTPAAYAVKKVTKTIPIVLGATGDPVVSGLVPSLARPGGNITGLSQNLGDIAPKSLELLKTILPKLSRVGVIFNPDNQSNAPILRSYQSAGPLLGIQVVAVGNRSVDGLERAFDALTMERVDAVVTLGDPLIMQQRDRVAALALKRKLPLLGHQRENVEAGSLISYGQPLRELFRRSAAYVDKIFKGAKPADLPIEQPNVFELVINQTTARALGITIPRQMTVLADQIIE